VHLQKLILIWKSCSFPLGRRNRRPLIVTPNMRGMTAPWIVTASSTTAVRADVVRRAAMAPAQVVAEAQVAVIFRTARRVVTVRVARAVKAPADPVRAAGGAGVTEDVAMIAAAGARNIANRQRHCRKSP